VAKSGLKTTVVPHNPGNGEFDRKTTGPSPKDGDGFSGPLPKK